jgi:hypothetical protein
MNVNSVSDVGNSVVSTEIKAFNFAGGGAGAASDIAESVLGLIGPAVGFSLSKVTITPNAALTASDTLFVTYTIAKRTAATPGTPVTIATATTKTSGSGGTGNWTAWVPVTIPLVAGLSLAPGDVITVTATHASTGTATPQFALEVFTAAN